MLLCREVYSLGMSVTSSEPEKTTISPREFYEKIINKEDFTLLDIRSKQVSEEWSLEFEGITTINYPNFGIEGDIPYTLEEKLSDDSEIVVACSKGKSSKMATRKLRESGYDARTLERGTNGWSEIYERREIPTSEDSLAVYQYVRPSSGCLGYMLVSEGEAVVIDPLKQYTDTYIADAENEDAQIEFVVDTHIHADHISGFNDLSERTGANRIMYRNSEERGVEYEFMTVEDGDTVEFGSETLEVLNTPGHTTDMTSYMVNDILLTGDSLFVDNIARPDLEDPDEAEDMAGVLYDTVQDMLKLPDNTIVAPGHKSGVHASDTLDNTFTERLDTILDGLDSLAYDREEFVEYVMHDMPPRPANYERIIEINKGIDEAPESEEYRLELGPNNCSAN